MKTLVSRLFVLLLVLSLVPLAAFGVNAETEQSYVATNTVTGVQYTDVRQALTEATAGQTVALQQDVQGISVLTVLESSTLDLNGFALTAKYVSSYGHIVDTSEDGTGMLTVAENRILIQEKNAQVPVRDGDGYRFLQVTGFNEAVLNEGSKYAFQPLMEGAAAELLQPGQASTGVTITVRVSWSQSTGRRTQSFVYSDEQVASYLASYDASTGKYGKMFSLTLRNAEAFEDLQFEAVVASAVGTTLGVSDIPDESVGDIVTDENNQITQEVTLNNDLATAVVPAGTLAEQGATQVTLTTTKLDSTTSNVTLESGEQMVSMDVHVDGVSADNTVPVIVTINELTLNGLNQGNIALYHVENGETVAMTRVYSLADLDTHNEYYYDIATGTITVALASFSEVTVISETAKPWEGSFDYSWYDADATELTIANADQLAAFGAIVGGMAADIEQDTFEGKIVTLMADINLADAEAENDESKIFHPIGYYYTDDNNGDGTTGDYYSTVYSFKGTFDGNGNTISNFYQNTWEIKGDYDGNYYKDAMGLFGYVVNGTVKNLTVDHFSSDGEFTPTGVIAAYAENSTFENIAITNCNPRVYNTGNGGIIGIGGRTNDTTGQTLTLRNITVDSTNKISALWGSWDVACGGLVGMFRGNASPGNGTIHFENCHVAAEIDVYNDVCANYQYYQYRYAGMLIGSVRHNETVNGKVVPVTDGITASDTTVLIGNWKNDYYCELVSNSIASYTHDYQFSRLTHITSLDQIKDGDNWTKAGNFILVDEKGMAITEGADAGCYHIVKDGDGFKRHFHEDSDYETVDVNGDGVKETVLVENNQRVYLPFPEQLFTGYSWGVSHIALGSFVGVEVSTVGESCSKFVSVAGDTYAPDTTVTIGNLFQAADSLAVSIYGTNVQVFVSPADENSTVTGTYVANISDWKQGTLTLSGVGEATITITDYYFCTPTTITVTVKVTKTDATVTAAPVANTLTYTGSAQALVSGGTAEGGTLVYSTAADGAFTETVPTGTDAGIYIVYYKVQGDSTHFDTDPVPVTVTIAKATPTVTTAPTAKNLTYTGSAQTLVTAGAVNGGTLVYSLTEDGTYTASVPTATNAGEYTVYYKVEGDSNYNAAEGGSVTVTIAKAVASCTVTANKGWTYDGEEQNLVTTSNVKGGSVVYSLAEDGEFTATIPATANAGTYTVYYKVLGNDNYTDSDVKSVTVTVEKAESTVTAAPVVKQELTYNKEAQPLVEAGTATGGEIWYKVEKQQTVATFALTRTVEVDEDGFSPEIPTATNAGTYTVYYKVKGDDNHNDSAVSQLTVTVAKADPVVTLPTVDTTYGDTLEDAALPDIEEGNDNNSTSGTLTWNDDTNTSVGNAGDKSFTATFTPEDTENYNTIEVEIPVQVQQAVPTYTLPENLTATYGDTLADVALTEGFSWKDASLSVGNAGTNTFTVVFNPGDSNYQTLELDVQVVVAKADPTYTIPTDLEVYYGKTLASVTLTGGFAWVTPDTVVTQTGKYEATYTPADTANYNTVNVSVPVEALPVVKFATKFTGDFLYRVGNQNTVALGSLFKAVNGVTIGTVSVTIEAVSGTGASGTYTANETWTNGTIQFSGTGVVKVTITDNECCIPTELYLEVVDAVNATAATNATANNVVLLNDISSGFTVSGRYTVYGNGFTLNYTGNGQYLNNGLKQGVVTVAENGTLDNLRIKATIYPAAYLYYGTNGFADAVQDGPSDGNSRYYYQLSAVAAKDNATISNCYVYGGRNNIFINTGDVTVKDTVLECGVVANVQIQSNSSHTVTFENVTTIQHQVNPTIGDTSLVMLGAGILVGPETTENPTIVLNGEFKQYNWVTADDANAVSDTKVTKAIIQGALDATAYNHTVNGKTASNLGIVYMNTYAATVTNNTGLPYVLDEISIKVSGNTISGQACSVQNATAEQIYSDYENADKSTVNGLYQPQFKYPADLGGQYIENTDGCDEYCYREGDTIKVMFPSGNTKELDLAALVNIVKYTGQDLGLVITCKDSNGNTVALTDNKIALAVATEYTVTYTVTDTLFFDKDGNTVTDSIEYSWDVIVSVSLKDKDIPNAYFEFDSSKQIMGYARKEWYSTDYTQYLPFLAGLKIYDYNGQTSYLRFDGDNDFNKIASVTITGYTSANHVLIEVVLTDGGVISIDTTARAVSGGSTYTGKIQTSGSTIYYVNDGTTSATTTTWVISNYSFTGNNGVEINSGSVTFANCENGSVPTGSFSTTINYTVTYDANGGNCGQTVGYATSANGSVTLPTPTKTGMVCAGWFTAASGGDKVGGAGDSYTPSANITLYAQWGKPSTVTYNANGGSCDTESEKYTGTALTLPTPTRDGYWFTGWYTAASGGTKVGGAGDSYQATGDITLYAQWSAVYTVTYNANGGSGTPASAKYEGTALTLPTPTRDGYAFNGWYTAASGGTKIGDGDGDASYTPTANITLYAQWKDPVTVTYNANGGSCGTTSQTYLGTPLTLPTPTRTGYKFNGWYTAASDGTKVGDAGATYTPSANTTLYAQWEEISYTITVSTSNATVSGVTNGQTAYYGDTITFTVTYSGDADKTTTVKDANGNTVTTTGSYTFTMPASDVTISASSSCITPDTLVTLADGTQVRVDSLTGDEELLVWNLVTGELDSAPILFVDSDPEAEVEVIHLYFSDGADVKVIYEHGFWDYDLNQYVYLDRYAEKYIGHTFAKQNGDQLEKVTLTDVVLETEVTTAWSPVTAGHLCYFVNGMLSMPGGVGGLFNIFEVDPETMTYDQEAMQRDIETYGLFTYEELNSIEPLSEEMFEAAGGAYLKVSIGKGNLTMDELVYMIRRYSKYFE